MSAKIKIERGEAVRTAPVVARIRFALGMLPEDEWPDAVSSVAKCAERMAAE